MTRSFHNAVVGFNHILAEPTHVFSEKGSEEMKRKILSLLLVFVLLCGMLPAALAEDTSHNHTWDNGVVTKEATCTKDGVKTFTCTDTNCPDSVKTKTEVISALGHSYGEWETIKTATCTEKGSRRHECSRCKNVETEDIAVTDHSPQSGSYKSISSSEHEFTCTSCGKVTEAHKISSGKCTLCDYTETVPDTNKLTLSKSSASLSGKGDYITLEATFTDKTVSLNNVTWKSDSSSIYVDSSKGATTRVYSDTNSKASARITAEITVNDKTYKATCDVTTSAKADIDISATVYNTNTGYALGDKDDAGNKSVVDKITAELSNKDYIKYVQFDSVSEKNKGSLSCRTKDQLDEDELAEVEFEPDEDFVGYVSFNFTLETKYDTYDGVLTFNVKKGTASNAKGDISYTGTRGGTVYFDARDFEDYFEDEYPRGELEYVTFSRASNGTVYYDGKKISTSDEFYANPGKRDKDLDEVYYEPSSDTYTGTATVSFTAYGENSSGTSKSTSGVVSIVYSSANAKDISYQATNGSVRLNTDDFVSTYKKATGVTSSNPTMYIRFTKLPSKGNLYVNYTSNGGGSRVSTSTYYSSKSSASNYIGDITYAADAAGGTETVEYTAYSTDSTSGLKYSGKIVFTANATNNTVPTTPVNISYTCTGGSVKFSNADFSGSSSSMMLIDYLVFGTPSTGALYTNYAGGTGNAVTSGQRFDYVGITSLGTTAVSSVSYVPPMGWSGTASVPFSAYLIGGGTITGTVTISVTAAATTVLRDVRTTDWYATYVTDLLAAGVLTGYEDNTFRAANNVTYGEILKLVMLATGYAEQSKSGAHWASGYVDRALTDGILTERVDPDAYASRAAVADIAARAMRLSPVTDGVNPFTDSVNGYARALYNAGIITGYEEGGRTYYRGGNPIERAHIAAIICRIMDYTGKAPSQPSTTPTPPRTDVEIPDWLRS